MTRVSVIIPAYNHERFVAEAIESVLSQRGDFALEVIVGDDASTDGTASVIRAYGDRFPETVRVLPPREHLGLTKNFERCFLAATGDFVSVCEGDDYWARPDKLALEVDFLRRRADCALCFSGVAFREEKTRAEQPHPAQASLVEAERTFTTRELIAGNVMGIFGTYRASVVRKIPQTFFDLAAADWLFNIACSRHGLIGFVNAVTYVIRIHGANTTSFFPSASDAARREPQIRMLLENLDSYDQFLDREFHADFERVRSLMNAYLASLPARE